MVAGDVESIFDFENTFTEKLHAIDTRAHCKACYAGELAPDNGDDYISADDFLYQRCVVIANGSEFYENVLSDPTQMPQVLEFECLLSLPSEAYEQKTGEEYDHCSPLSYESFQNLEGWKPTEETQPGRFTGDAIPPGNRRPT